MQRSGQKRSKRGETRNYVPRNVLKLDLIVRDELPVKAPDLATQLLHEVAAAHRDGSDVCFCVKLFVVVVVVLNVLVSVDDCDCLI